MDYLPSIISRIGGQIMMYLLYTTLIRVAQYEIFSAKVCDFVGLIWLYVVILKRGIPRLLPE